MYRCEYCKAIVRGGRKIIVYKRPKTYEPRKGVNRPMPYIDEKGKRKYRIPDDPGGTGWEIIREVNVCAECEAKRKPAEPVAKSFTQKQSAEGECCVLERLRVNERLVH